MAYSLEHSVTLTWLNQFKEWERRLSLELASIRGTIKDLEAKLESARKDEEGMDSVLDTSLAVHPEQPDTGGR